jgi:hypothetical protein
MFPFSGAGLFWFLDIHSLASRRCKSGLLHVEICIVIVSFDFLLLAILITDTYGRGSALWWKDW